MGQIKTVLGKVGFTPRGEYSENTVYERLDIVTYEGNSYLVLKDSLSGITPAADNVINYMLMANKGDNGHSPKIQDGTWWIWSDETKEYINTTVAVNSDYELTKQKIENVLTGNVPTHSHDQVIGLCDILTDVWDGTSISDSLSGSGTKDDPYLVQSCADWLHLNLNGARYGREAENAPADITKIEKFVKVTKNLDFNGHQYSYPDIEAMSNEEINNALLLLTDIDGQGAVFKNLNLKNTASVLFLPTYCVIHDIGIESSIFIIDVSALESNAANEASFMCAPFNGSSDAFFYNFAYNCCCKATFRTIGIPMEAINKILIGVVGIVLGVNILEEKDGAYYADNRFENEVDVINKQVYFQYIPVFSDLNYGSIAKVHAYDISHTGIKPVNSSDAGFYCVMVGMPGATLYYNSDVVGCIEDVSESDELNYIPKTTVELKSSQFLTLINEGKDFFVFDVDNINNGYPHFPVRKIETVMYDGYVSNSTFTDFLKTKPVILRINYPVWFSDGGRIKPAISDEVKALINSLGGLDFLFDALCERMPFLNIYGLGSTEYEIWTEKSGATCYPITYRIETDHIKSVCFQTIFSIGYIVFSCSFNKLTNKYSVSDSLNSEVYILKVIAPLEAGLSIDGQKISGSYSMSFLPNEVFKIERSAVDKIDFFNIRDFPTDFTENAFYAFISSSNNLEINVIKDETTEKYKFSTQEIQFVRAVE